MSSRKEIRQSYYKNKIDNEAFERDNPISKIWLDSESETSTNS